MSLNTILATAPLTSTGYHLKATGTTIGNSLIWDNGTNVGLSTVSPVSTNLVGSMTIVKSYNSDTPTSTTAQTYYTNQSNLYLFGRNAGLSIITNSTNEEGTIFFGNASTVAYASINTGSGTSSVGGDMYFKVGSNTERMRITSAGNVGIGTSSPNRILEVATGGDTYLRVTGNRGNADDLHIGNVEFYNSNTTRIIAEVRAITGTGGTQSNSGQLAFYTNNAGTYAERMRITSGGNVGIGTSSPDWPLTVKTDASANSIKIIGRTGGDNALAFYGSDASTLYGHIDVGASYFQIYTSNSQPMQFFTGGSERMRITSGGKVMVNTTDSGVNALLYASASSSEPYPLGSKATTSSQGLVGFFDSANGLQGSISISGTTVSYNSFLGSHWSQLSDNSKPEILTGTILEAIDELCVWDNATDERLPKVKISDTIESKNIYGVFSNWDNTDDYNDMYVAAVGAGFIRVNSGSIVSMGDLLQSNGDGTAKIQSDDIMRSSTIAKVVSTQKIETYEDGSYLIAATLHCG